MRIGIGGCSCSGKTTLAEALAWHYRTLNKTAIVLHQDDFVRRTSDIPRIKDRTDWETPASIDFGRLDLAVRFFEQHFEVVLVEGLFAFADAALGQSYDFSFFVEITQSTFQTRRTSATRWGAEPDWFVQHVWDSFLKYGQPTASAIRVSGEQPFDVKAIAPVLG